MSDGTATINNVTNSRFDNEEYRPDDGAVDVATCGSANQVTGVNSAAKDPNAAQSETTGRISKREVDGLRVNHFPGEGDALGTRGVDVDAYKQERDVDASLDEHGTLDADQDVEFGAASGRR